MGQGRLRKFIGAADEALTWEEQGERIRKVASQSLVKLDSLLRMVESASDVAKILAALVDAQRLAREATKKEDDPGKEYSREELEAIAKESK